MNQKYFDEIKAREQAATPGPWEADYNRPFSDDFVGIYEETEGYIVKAEDEDEGYSTCPEDAAFIVHARTDIPALLSEVERLTAENATLKKALELMHADMEEAAGVPIPDVEEYVQQAQEQEGKK